MHGLEVEHHGPQGLPLPQQQYPRDALGALSALPLFNLPALQAPIDTTFWLFESHERERRGCKPPFVPPTRSRRVGARNPPRPLVLFPKAWQLVQAVVPTPWWGNEGRPCRLQRAVLTPAQAGRCQANPASLCADSFALLSMMPLRSISMLQSWEAGPADWRPPLPSSLRGAEASWRGSQLTPAGACSCQAQALYSKGSYCCCIYLYSMSIHHSKNNLGSPFLGALPPVAGRSCVWQCLSGPPCALAVPRSACSPTVSCRSWQGCALPPSLHRLAPTSLPAGHAIVRVHQITGSSEAQNWPACVEPVPTWHVKCTSG